MLPLDVLERAARTLAPVEADTARWPLPGDLALELDPQRTVNTPALALIDQALRDLVNTPDGRLILSMPPQEGKSTRVSRRFPLWVLTQKPDTRIAICSYEHGVARRLGRAIRDDVTQYGEQLGLAIRPDLSAQNEWQLAGHDGAVYTVGIGGALTGRPVDLLIIDDPLKDREQADSATYRDRVWDWWLEVGATRLAPGAPVALILTRWHDDDLAGRLMAAPDGALWHYLNIPAQADHRPEAGEVDPLGRRPGEYLASARGRTPDQWEAIKVRSGSRTWSALYQGAPSPDTGDVWKRQWWRRYHELPWRLDPDSGAYLVDGMDDLIMSWDMAFKDTKSSDYVVGQVWARKGATAYLLEQVRKRLSFTDTVAEFQRMTARWPQAGRKLVEDKANGSAVIDTLRSKIPGIVAENPTDSKYGRASSVAPFIEAGNVLLPHADLDAGWDPEDLITEAAAFPYGTHDDQVDATSQALHRLLGDGTGWSSWMTLLDRMSGPAPSEPLVSVAEAEELDPRQAARLAQFRAQS